MLTLRMLKISSLKRFMMRYENGAFKKYVDRKDLILTEAMLGESLVPKGVSDNHKDPANSIYSVSASQERKAEISVLVQQ